MKVIAPFVVLVLTFATGFAQRSNDSSQVKKAPWFVERFKVTAGFFFPVSNTDVQVGIKGGVAGTDIDFETDLGLDKGKATFLTNFQWRASRRSKISIYYYNIPRNGTRTISKDISFNGQTYPVNASVNSYFNTSIYQVTYGYAILAKPRYELGLLIGTHLVGGEAGMSINNPNGSISGNTNFGFTAPLPDLGIWGGYAFSNRLAINLEFVYLSMNVGDVSGRILSYNLNFMYRLLDRLDVSLGISGLNSSVSVTKTNADASFKWGYNGPALGVSYSFGKKSWN